MGTGVVLAQAMWTGKSCNVEGCARVYVGGSGLRGNFVLGEQGRDGGSNSSGQS